MRVNQNESITLNVAGADVTIKAAILADLWIEKLIADSRSAVTEIAPGLKEGERELGTIISADGSIRRRIILLPGALDDATWSEATDWAKANGGELPDRVEGALLFALLKDEFEEEAYWTRELHASYPEYAWYQYFYYGYQSHLHKSARLRARAVRSEPV